MPAHAPPGTTLSPRTSRATVRSHADEQPLWEEYGLRRLSAVCQRRLVVERAAPHGRALPGLVELLTCLLRGLQRFFFFSQPTAYLETESAIASSLASCGIIPCAQLECEWLLGDVRSQPEHASVLREGQEVYVHERDYRM